MRSKKNTSFSKIENRHLSIRHIATELNLIYYSNKEAKNCMCKMSMCFINVNLITVQKKRLCKLNSNQNHRIKVQNPQK